MAHRTEEGHREAEARREAGSARAAEAECCLFVGIGWVKIVAAAAAVRAIDRVVAGSTAARQPHRTPEAARCRTGFLEGARIETTFQSPARRDRSAAATQPAFPRSAPTAVVVVFARPRPRRRAVVPLKAPRAEARRRQIQPQVQPRTVLRPKSRWETLHVVSAFPKPTARSARIVSPRPFFFLHFFSSPLTPYSNVQPRPAPHRTDVPAPYFRPAPTVPVPPTALSPP